MNSTIGAAGMGLDIGASYAIKVPNITIVLILQDVNSPTLSWDSGAKDHLPFRLRAGASKKLFTQTLLATQYSWNEKYQRNQEASLGLEQEFFKRILTVRGGVGKNVSQWKYTFGFGVRVKTFLLDYGWERQNSLGDTQTFSLSVKF